MQLMLTRILLWACIFFEKGDFTMALHNFEGAKELDENTMFVDEYIVKTKALLKAEV